MAARGVDPAHPRSGANNIDAASDPTRNATDPVKIAAAKRMTAAASSDVATYSRSGPQVATMDSAMAFSLVA